LRRPAKFVLGTIMVSFFLRPTKGWLLAILVLQSCTHASAAAATAADFKPVIKAHLARYPAMELQDCYKLLYQACLGSEHAVGDTAAATRWLDQELASLGDGPVEPAIDPLTPDGRIVRVHLRPFVQQHGDKARLAQAFVETGQTFRGSRETLAAAWEQVVQLAAARELPFTAAAARTYGKEMAAAGNPAVHHSEKFTRLYHPAYRVIAREYLPGLLPDQ